MIVIDTHVWIWWMNGVPSLKRDVRARIDQESDVRVSAISLLEIAQAAPLGRLPLLPSPERWLEIAQAVTPRFAWSR